MRRLAVVWPILIVVFAGCEGRPRSNSPAGEVGKTRTGPPVAILDLSESVPEQASAGIIGLSPRAVTMEDLIEQVDLIERDNDVPGVLVRLGSARLGLARASEIGAMLASMRDTRKRPVWCHADDLNNGSLYLVARGCSRAWVSPAGSVDAIGLAAQTIYFHKLLADKLGLDVDFLQVGKFKGAEEPFTRDGPSTEARQSLQTTLSNLRETWLQAIRSGRAGAGQDAAEDGPYSAQAAKEGRLVDEVGYFDEAKEALEKVTGATGSDVRLGPSAASGGRDDLGDVLRTVAGASLGEAPVVVVPAVGAISMDGGGAFGEGGGIAARKMMRTLSRLEDDDEVKAVVLRIDSPGGSALASDLMWRSLMRIRRKKALVVSIGDMAASGGYYLASAGATVFADDTSIVGSIGVVGGKIAADHALESMGVHAETFAAKGGSPGAAARAGYESLLVPWDDATRVRVLATMTDVYRLFVSRVSEGRGMPVSRVAESAEGRIFSGRDGKLRGLVDTIGGLREALKQARTMAGLPVDARVNVSGEPSGLLQMLAADDSAGGARSVQMSVAMTRSIAPLVPLAASLEPMVNGEAVLCALPFALTIR